MGRASHVEMTLVFTFDVLSLDATWRGVCSASGTTIIGPPWARTDRTASSSVPAMRLSTSSVSSSAFFEKRQHGGGGALLDVSLGRGDQTWGGGSPLLMWQFPNWTFQTIPSVFDIGSDRPRACCATGIQCTIVLAESGRAWSVENMLPRLTGNSWVVLCPCDQSMLSRSRNWWCLPFGFWNACVCVCVCVCALERTVLFLSVLTIKSAD